MFFKRTVPFLITLSVGIFTFLYYFIPHEKVQNIWDIATTWAIIIGGGAMAVGVVSMIRTYSKRAMNREDPNRYYGIITILSMVTMTLIGLIGGITPETLFNNIFINILAPLEATMFSLLSFYMASAAFRSFRLKSFSAGLLLLSAIIVMLAQIPTGEIIYKDLPIVKDWILRCPNVAGQRAIMMGIAIGAAATALKIILGIDKSVFAGVEK